VLDAAGAETNIRAHIESTLQSTARTAKIFHKVFWSRRPKRSIDVRPARCKLREVILNSVLSSFGLAACALRAVLRVQKIGIDAVVDMEHHG